MKQIIAIMFQKSFEATLAKPVVQQLFGGRVIDWQISKLDSLNPTVAEALTLQMATYLAVELFKNSCWFESDSKLFIHHLLNVQL